MYICIKYCVAKICCVAVVLRIHTICIGEICNSLPEQLSHEYKTKKKVKLPNRASYCRYIVAQTLTTAKQHFIAYAPLTKQFQHKFINLIVLARKVRACLYLWILKT